MAIDLSKREREVLNLLTQGLANKHIASQLGISTKMVEKICTRLYKKLAVSNRAEAIIWALHKNQG